MNIAIEKALLNDIDELELLYNDICDYLATKEYNPGWRKGCFPTKNDALYFIKDNSLYVAKIDGKIVGSIALTHTPNSESNENSRYIETKYDDILFIHVVVVHPAYLRKGIGTIMLNFAEQLGIKERVKSLRLYVYENNYVEINTYKKNGYSCLDKVDIGLSQYGLELFCLYEKEIVY